MPAERAQNLQDTFLNHVRKSKVPLTIFLVNGVKLQGVVTWFDNFCVLLRRDGHSQLVYKHAIDLEVVQSGIVPINQTRPATYMGTGKVEEIAGLVKSLEAGIVVCDCALSPVQQRNLEKAWGAKVLDRTGLILEIFGRRATTK